MNEIIWRCPVKNPDNDGIHLLGENRNPSYQSLRKKTLREILKIMIKNA